MAIQWPLSLDDLDSLETWPGPYSKALIKALTTKLQRMLNAQPSAAPVAGGTVTPDMSLGWRLLVTIPSGVNTITIANPVNPQQGDFLVLYTLQNATGTGLLTFGSHFRKTTSISIPAAVATSLDAVVFDYSAGADRWNQIGVPVLGLG
jgi:hypothetical protein